MNYFKALFSPFKPFRVRFYIGKTAIGVPYFYPRRWIKDKNKPGYMKAVPLKIGFNYCGLGWKTKYESYRFEWSPTLSFVFLGFQIAARIVVEHPDMYWESWLYYENDTDKTKGKRERIEQCRKEYPQIWTAHPFDGEPETIDYYTLILREKYLTQK